MRRIIAGLAALALVFCYASTLGGMVHQWWTDEDMGHGFLVPFVIAWIVWRERGRWKTLPVQPTLWGFAVLAWQRACKSRRRWARVFLRPRWRCCCRSSAWCSVCSASRGCELGPSRCCSRFSCCRSWRLSTTRSRCRCSFWPRVWRVGCCRRRASWWSRDGNILNVAGHSISVVEACDGIRYLLPLAFLALVFAYAAGAKSWMRVAMLAAAIPTAILANALRVAFSGLSPKLTEGTPHALLGTLIFLLCLGLIAGIYHLLMRWQPNDGRS